MTTYTYDDGSTLTDDGTSITSTPGLYSPMGVWGTDAREQAKLNGYVYAAPGDSRPWYERVAEYGLTRAIDAQVGPSATNKGSAQASYAGQNGLTYPVALGGIGISMPMLLLLAAGVALVVFLKD